MFISIISYSTTLSPQTFHLYVTTVLYLDFIMTCFFIYINLIIILFFDYFLLMYNNIIRFTRKLCLQNYKGGHFSCHFLFY